MLCRGAIQIGRLQWDGKRIEVTLSSAKPQTITMELPSEIAELSVTKGDAKASPAGRDNQRTLALPGGQPVTLVIKLK